MRLLLQGVVDCCIEEAGELVIIDYKTDYVKTDEDIAAVPSSTAASSWPTPKPCTESAKPVKGVRALFPLRR